MKKHMRAVFLLCLAYALVSGCAVKSATGGGDPGSSGGTVVDLTSMSSTMVYAEVSNIVAAPDDYVGKTIKVSGPYSPLYYDVTDDYYHYIEITDATGCCPQGLEFVWKGNHTYPDDYPEESSNIELTGVYGSYEEQGMTYYYLSVDDVKVLE